MLQIKILIVFLRKVFPDIGDNILFKRAIPFIRLKSFLHLQKFLALLLSIECLGASKYQLIAFKQFLDFSLGLPLHKFNCFILVIFDGFKAYLIHLKSDVHWSSWAVMEFFELHQLLSVNKVGVTLKVEGLRVDGPHLGDVSWDSDDGFGVVDVEAGFYWSSVVLVVGVPVVRSWV